jgi:hypothetical protein
MATYGYSTPYTGRGDTGPLPPGFMEAATAPGRNLAMGIAAMGQGLGKAIEQYRTKKAETEAATQSWETVSGLMQQQLASDPKYLAIQQYMETGALPQGVTEQDIPRYTQQVMADREMLNKFSALGEKFPDMSLAKKKAALGDAVMVLNQYRTDQQNQVRDALAQQQLRLTEFQLSEAQRRAQLEQNLGQALGQVARIPTSQTTTVEQAPAFITSSLNLPAAEQPYTPFYQVQQVPLAAQQPPAAVQAPQGPMFGEYSFGAPRLTTPSAVAQYAQGLGRGIMPIPAGTTREQFTPATGAQAPTVQPSVGIAPIQQRETPLFESGPIRTTAQQEQAVPFQDRFRQATQIFERLNVPLNVETINKVLEATGTPAPIRATETQLPSGATVISAGGRIEVLPPPKPVEGKDLTEGQANAAGFAARMVYNENLINKALSSGYSPGDITVVGFMPERWKSDDRKTYESAKENWIAANLRKESGAAIGEKEYADADRQYFPQPGDSQKQVQEKASRRKVAERSMRSAVGRNSEFYIQQILGGAQEQRPGAAAGGVLRYNPLTKKFE